MGVKADPTESIKAWFEAPGQTYGSPRLTLDLWDEGWTVSRNTVAEIMAAEGLQGRRPRAAGVR